MPENTLHDFLGPLASGFWPENALNFDILAIIWRLKVHFELKLPIYLVFMVALAIMNPFTYRITPYMIFLDLWPPGSGPKSP